MHWERGLSSEYAAETNENTKWTPCIHQQSLILKKTLNVL